MQELKALREKEGLSQKNVADQLGVSQQAVAQWERGQGFPRAELLPKLANLFGCTIDSLYGRDTQDTA